MKCKSYIRDTKDFLNKLQQIKNIPTNAKLVTMDVSSLYTNIDHNEGAEACFERLENRNNKSVPSEILKRVILLVLKSNIFRFGSRYYKQMNGCAMGTPMAPNVANLFMSKLESKIIHEHFLKTGHKPLVRMRYIDDIFFIWTGDDNSLQDFVNVANSFTEIHHWKSNIKFETNISSEKVNFLDVEIGFKNNKIVTNLYNKPTDAHIYLNAHSCHPNHLIKNIPKRQYIRIKRICSEKADFQKHSQSLTEFFLQRGYSNTLLGKVFEDVKK